VRRLLSEPAYAERAGRLGQWAARHDAGAIAADALEGVAAGWA
jgi:UDP:flavonoid glycosyltransferase YjiC (YdhE family)